MPENELLQKIRQLKYLFSKHFICMWTDQTDFLEEFPIWAKLHLKIMKKKLKQVSFFQKLTEIANKPSIY